MNTLKKNNNLITRVITAVILAALIFIGLFTLPKLSFSIVLAFILFIAAAEWPSIIGKRNAFNSAAFICGLVFLLILSFFAMQFRQLVFILLSVSFFYWLWLFQWIIYYEKRQALLLNSTIVYVLIGYINLMLCWIGLSIIRDVTYGTFFVLLFLLLIWGADTVAYFAGKRWGTAKLIPNVSPKKTWAGVYAALIFSLILGCMVALLFPLPTIQRLGLIPLALIVCIFSIMGDLLISIFKRNFNLKDSGALIPGHGGVLDRIDSLIAAAPIFALGLLVLGLY